jgi:lipocalin
VDNYSNIDSVNGKVSATGKGFVRAVITNPKQPSKLLVAPKIVPIAAGGDYWVIATGPLTKEGLYSWSVVSAGPPRQVTENNKCIANAPQSPPFPGQPPSGNGQGLWIFSRQQIASDEEVSNAKEVADAWGLDTGVLNKVEQAGCLYQV